jgi:hypothetical protein
MQMKRYWIAGALALALAATGFSGDAQKPADADANVPALESFHKVVRQIWHDAWPKKDTAMLRSLLPEVEKGIAEVASAQLPGILRERKAAWNEAVKQLQRTGSEYKAAAAGKDDTKLLASAEALHGRFEGLARALWPSIDEMDDFHAVLYMLYHYYLPKYDSEKIKSSIAELTKKMAALNAADLPKNLKQKESEFKEARAKLSKSVDALKTAIQSNQEKTIKAAIETMHTNYQALERIFE